ncbi:MAG TPA: hypothetical protein VGF69_12180 [Thermoanaerobaculia bacterium]|jgi:hypothetical protein
MKVRYWLAVAVALFAVLTLLERFALVELLVRRVSIPLFLAVAEALAIVAVGALVRRSRPLDLPLDFLLGYPIFGAICFLVGALKIDSWTMVPLLVAGALGGAWMASQYGLAPSAARTTDNEQRTTEAEQRTTISATLALLCILITLACGFVFAQAPPATLDELAYHLAVPRAWVLEGRAIELPLISHSYFPLGIESADLPLLTILGIDGGVASHFLHLFAAIATTMLIARRTRSWLATAALVTTPALALTAGWSLVDWPLAGICVALAVALENDNHRTSAVATAAGMLTKYTFLPFALLAYAGALLMKKRIAWKPLALAVAAGSLFLIRNVVLTGNPFAPFLGADAPHVAGYRGLFLADYIFEGTFVDEALGASLLALCVFATGRIALLTLLGGIVLFFLSPSSRILIPFLIVPAMTAAEALQRRTFAILIAVAVVVQTFLVVWFTDRNTPFSLLSGAASEQQYLTKQRAPYADIAWLNQTLPRSSRTLVVGVNETYWFTRPVRGAGNFDGERVSRYLDLPTPDALYARLKRDGITHIAVLSPTLGTTVEIKLAERQTDLAPSAQRMLSRVLDLYAANVTSRGNVALFTLR